MADNLVDDFDIMQTVRVTFEVSARRQVHGAKGPGWVLYGDPYSDDLRFIRDNDQRWTVEVVTTDG